MRPVWSEADYQMILARHGSGKDGVIPPRTARIGSGYKSKLEVAFAQKLALEQRAGFIAGWAYEPLNFRLPGTKNFYKIDFIAWGALSGMSPVFYEIKGRNKSDDVSLVKMKAAAGLNLWARFVLVHRINGEWVEREIT